MQEELSSPQPIQEISRVIQGEGKLMGVPHILIRLSGCRLRCQFSNSFCDTWYTSWKPEKGGFTLQDVVDFIEKNSHITHVFITGGGPTIHQKLLPSLVDLCKNMGQHVTIETEGSEFVATNADLISLSPKLSNSTPKVGSQKHWGGEVTEKEKEQHEKYRKNYDAMRKLIRHQLLRGKDVQVKPVLSSVEDLIEFKELQDELRIPNSRCWLMPEGITDEQLSERRQWLFDVCTSQGYNFTDRLHVITYGDRRGV